MRTRQQMVLNLVLLVAAMGLAWRLAADWKQANRRYEALAESAPVLPTGGPITVAQKEAPPTDEIVQKNLFSPDRNSDAPQEKSAAPPPPRPVVYGTMKLGSAYEALMGEGGTGDRSFRRVKTGDEVGPYKVVEIRDEKVVVELEGQRTTLDVYQSANSMVRETTRTVAPAAPVVESAGSAPPSKSAPATPNAAPAPGATQAQQSPEPGVRVTIEGNRKKLQRDTPFGTQTWYEPLQ